MKRTLCLWTILLCFACLVGFLHPASAEDLAVDWVTVMPIEGEVGDTITLQARIKNNGPGMVFSIQYGWYLSMDNEITTDDMAVGDMVTLFNYLYTGYGTVITDPITVPAFADLVAPSHFGLIVDPLRNSFDYKSYLLSNDGATLIHLDTDRNPNTGWATTNLAGDTTLGADYVLRSYWDYNDLIQMTHLYRTLPPESLQSVRQFATPTQANRLYLTLPLESIGSPSGPVDILVRTASWGGGSGILLPNDDLPDSGVVTLATLPSTYLGDLDADADVDGRDLAILSNNPGSIGLGDFTLDYGKAA